MKLSLTKQNLITYTSSQLNNIFPDNSLINLNNYAHLVDLALDRVDYCFKKVTYKHYFDGTDSLLNHLHADQYLMYVWFLSNTIAENSDNISLANKLYYLNKTLHGFDCMYNTKLPNIFLVFHGVGTMLGKATYNDYFVCLQGVTVGSQKHKYPVFGKGVGLAAHSSVIGNCNIGNRTSVSAYTQVFETSIPNDSVVFKNKATSALEIKTGKECYTQQFFNLNLKELV
jgi:serine O-acetyltransferase